MDGDSRQRLGHGPGPGARSAELVARLDAAGARVIGFDVIFAEPDRNAPARVLERWGDNEVLKSIAAALPDSLAGRCHVVAGQGLSPGSVRRLVRGLDFVIAGRMHLAIACLAEGVPVAGVTYQGKFEGLFGYFELGDMLIAADAAFEGEGDGLAAFAVACTADLAGARERIMHHRERVIALAERNFLR